MLSSHRKVDKGGNQLIRLNTNNDEKIRTSWLVFIALLGHHSHSLNKKLNYTFTLEDSFTPSNRAEAASWPAACSQTSCSSQSERQWGIAFLLPRLQLLVTVPVLSQQWLLDTVPALHTCSEGKHNSTGTRVFLCNQDASKSPAGIYITHFPARALNSLQFYPTSVS